MRRYTPENLLPLSEFYITFANYVRRRIPKNRRYDMFESEMYEEYAEAICEDFDVVSKIATMKGVYRPTPKVLIDMDLVELRRDAACSKCGTVVDEFFYMHRVYYKS